MGMEHYTKIRDLNGSTEVFLAADKQNPAKRVVIKRLADDAQGMEELSVSVRMQHPNIVKFLESFVHEGGLYVVTHYERGGDLESLLSRLTTLAKKPTRSTLLHWFQQLLSAVSFCHAQHVIHRDIKPGNIFLSHDTKDVFVGDFGSAKKLSPTSAMTSTFAGSPMWLSPEVLMGTPYTFSSDMWSLGCVLYEMASLHRPFSATSFARLVQQVTAGEVAPLPATVPEDVQRLIMEMLVVDPQQRIDAESALKRVEEAIAREPAVVVKKKATANNNNNNNNKKSGGGGGGNAQPPPPTHVPPRAQAAAARHGDRQPTSRPVSPERLPSSPSNNNNNNNNAHIFFDKPVTKQGSGSLPNRTPHPLLGHTKAPQDERRGGSAGGTTTTTSRSSTTEGNTARPGQWMDARARDVSVIEKYLHKFREHDDEVLHSYNEKTGMLNAVFAKNNNNNNNGRRTSLSGSSLGLGSPNARRARSPHNRSPAVSAPRRVVAPTTSGAVVVKREPSTSSVAHNNKNVVATKEPPQRVVSKHVSRPVEKVVGAPPPPVSVAVLRKPPPPPPPAPTSAAAVAVPRKRRGDGLERGHVIESINFSRQTSNLSNHSITPAHQPRQASHARPVRQLTSAEQKRAEEQRSKAREQREGERNKMVEMIRERRAEAAKKKAVNVSIMLPDKLQYTEDGIQKVDG